MGEDGKADARKLIYELIPRQRSILGPDITIAKVKKAGGIEISENGEILKIDGDENEILRRLAHEFSVLSSFTVKEVLHSIVQYYPHLDRLAKTILQAYI